MNYTNRRRVALLKFAILTSNAQNQAIHLLGMSQANGNMLTFGQTRDIHVLVQTCMRL